MLKALNISTKQLGIAMAMSVFVVLLTFIPIIYGTAISGDKYFTGKTVYSRYDLYTYLSWIEQGREGKLFFKQLYSSEVQPEVFFHPVFLVAGQAANLVDISNLSAYYILRAVSVFIFLITTFLLICKFLPSNFERFLALTLVSVSSGFGFLITPDQSALWVYEFNTFSNISSTALDPLGLSFVFAVFLIVLLKFAKRNWKYILLAATLTNLLAISHTYDLVLLFLVTMGYGIWRLRYEQDRHTLINVLYLLLFTFPGVLWQASVLKLNSVLGVWAFLQSQVHSSPLLVLIVQFGFILLLGIFGIIFAIKDKRKELAFLIIWVVLGFALIYTPVLASYQRKFGIGYHVVLCIFTAYALQRIFNSLLHESKRFAKLGITALIVLYLASSNIYVVGVIVGREYQYNPDLYFITQDEYNGIKWLKENVEKSAVILSDYGTSNLIPGMTGLAVFVGHYDQTVSVQQKYGLISYTINSSGDENDPLRSFVKRESIGYIVINRTEERSRKFSAANRSYLSLKYKNSDVEIYKVE